MQTTLDFTSRSPINRESLTKQSKIVLGWLSSGITVTTVLARQNGIYNLQSRISEVRAYLKKQDITIYDRYISIGGSVIKEYSLTKFD